MPPHLAGQNTLFPLKVLRCLENEYSGKMHAFKMRTFFSYSRYEGFTQEVYQKILPKFHTIREDKGNRWKAERDIQLVINNRTKNRYQFAPVIPCVSVQPIKIEYDPKDPVFPNVNVLVSTGNNSYKLLGIYSITQLALNDGFDTVEDFFAWFNKDCTAKIIHWTNLRY